MKPSPTGALKPKPGSRILFLVGFLAWILGWQTLPHSSLETDLYDYQVALVRQRYGEPKMAPELVLSAIDREAYAEGARQEELSQIAEALPTFAVDITGQNLEPFFKPDSDGLLRSIYLYRREGEALEFAPPLVTLLKFRGLSPAQVEVTKNSVKFPGGELKTDSEGRFYPFFQVADSYSYRSSYSRFLSATSSSKEQGAVDFNPLQPVPLLNLLKEEISLQGRLILLGMYLNVADSIEFDTPVGDMVRIELYGTVLNSLLSPQSSFAPFPQPLNILTCLLFLAFLSLVLPGRRTSSAMGWWFAWAGSWLGFSQVIFSRGFFLHQSAVLLAGLTVLLAHLLLRSWRVHLLLRSLGGLTPLQKSGEEIVATILFTNLPETIKDLESNDLERSHDARAAYSKTIGYSVNRFGGRLVDLQGDAQMIAFGLEGEANHRSQALACALDIVTRVNQLLETPDGDNAVFCGVVTGPVATGQVGGGQYHSVAAVGDTTNSAARLMGQAKKTGAPVLASVDTVEPLGPKAEASEVGEISVKGRAEPLKVWEVKSLFSPPPVEATPLTNDSANLPRQAFLALSLASLLVTVPLSSKLPFHEMLLDSLTPNTRRAPIVFAGLDEESLAQREWPWPRHLHAKVIENCVRAGAKCVFLDFLFEDPSTPEEDLALTQAVNNHSQALVAAAAREDGYGDALSPQLLPGLAQSDRWGLINHAPGNTADEFRYALWEIPLDQHTLLGPGIAQKMVRILKPEVAESLKGRREYLIRWGPLPQTVSYHRLLDPGDPIFEELKGKTVICGDNLRGRSDAFETPVGSLKGALIHALSLQTLLTGGLLDDVSTNVFTWSLVWAFGTLILYISWRLTSAASQIALLVAGVAAGIVLATSSASAGLFVGSGFSVIALTSVIFGWVLSVTETNRAMTNYIPRRLQEQLERDGTVADITTTATILLTDIRGYTTLSEGRSPSEILSLLNSYHEKTAAIYEKNGGHLITYQGDAQIVVFGPLDPIDNPVLAAVRSAQQLPKVVFQVAQEAGLEDGVLRVGSGITTGEVTLSLMGTSGQLQYSVFGAPVRAAHHLQSLSDRVDGAIILDERSSHRVKDSVPVKRYRLESETICTV